MSGWRYYYRRYFGWLPVQFCMVCGKPYWGGLPRPAWLVGYSRQWMPWWSDYCSQRCCDMGEFDVYQHWSGGWWN